MKSFFAFFILTLAFSIPSCSKAQGSVLVNGVFWETNTGSDLNTEVYGSVNGKRVKLGQTDAYFKYDFKLPTNSDSLIFIAKNYPEVTFPTYFEGSFALPSKIRISVTIDGNLSQKEQTHFMLICHPEAHNLNDNYILYGFKQSGEKYKRMNFSLIMKNCIGFASGNNFSENSKEVNIIRKSESNKILLEKTFELKRGFTFVDMNEYSNENQVQKSINYSPTPTPDLKAFGDRTLYFEQSKFDLLATHKATLDSLAIFLQKNQSTSVSIKGYSDNVGKATLNEELAKFRAKAVSTYLAQQSVFAKQMKLSWTSAVEINKMQNQGQDLSKYRKVIIQEINQ